MTIEFANRLAELRKEKGYSQEDLAGKLGVSRQAISKWERGEATPDSDNLIALSSLYGVSLDELVHQKRGEGKVLDDKTEDDEEKEDSEEKEHENPRRGDTPSFHADGGRRDGTRYDGEDEPAASHGS